MALLECDRSRPIFFLRKTNSAPYSFHPELKYFEQTQSASVSPHTKRKIRLNHQSIADDMIIDSKGAAQISSHPLNVIEKHQLITRTTGLSPGARRLKISSATVSPLKPALIPKRLATSELNSPCPLKKRIGSLAISPPRNKQTCYENQIQTHSESISSSQYEHDNVSLSPELSSPTMFPGLNEFSFCDQCSKLCSRSLDFWMDHLGECHPVPISWPSVRADHLDERSKMNPYTAVVGSNKKRKGSGVPRPLNSFMIFAQYIRRVVLHWFPDAPNVHISQRVGQLWRKLDGNMREQYALEAFQLQKLHAIEFPNYKYQPRKRSHNVQSNSTAEMRISESSRPTTVSRERESTTPRNQSKQSIPSSVNNKIQYPSQSFNNHSVIYLNNLLQDYDASKIPALVIAHHGSQSGEIIVQESSKDSLKKFISSQNFTELKPFQICTNIPESQKSLSKYCLDKLLLGENNQVDETLTSLVSGDNAEEQSPTISSTSNSAEIEGSIRSKSLDPNGSDEPIDYRFHIGRSHMIEDLLTSTAVFCSSQMYERNATSRAATTTVPLLHDQSNILRPSVAGLMKLEDSNHSEHLIDPDAFSIKLHSLPLQINVPYSHSFDSDTILRPSVKQEMTDVPDQIRSNLPKSHSLATHCKLPRLETGSNLALLTRSSTALPEFKTSQSNETIALDVVDGRYCPRFLQAFKPNLDQIRFTNTSSHVSAGSMTIPTSSARANLLSDPVKLDVYANFDDLDTGFGFDDLDTCKSGTSLDDLDHIVLFNANLTSDKSPTDHSNTMIEFPPSGHKLYDSESLLTTVDEVLGNMTDTNGLSPEVNMSFERAIRVEADAREKADFTLLPSIESWTFGALNGGN